ncbi:9508_t:CDS:2, partial [Scutellospora calospora]
DKTKEKLNQIRIDKINLLQTPIQSKTKILKRLQIPEDSILRQPNNADSKRNINETDTLTKELINYLYEEQLRKKTYISIPRLKKDKIYKKLKGYPLIYRKKKYSSWNPLWIQEEQIDDIQNIQLIIGEYKESLFDKLSITQKNIDIIQNTLSEMIGYYTTENEKRNFLDLTVKILVNGNIDVEDIEDDSIRNMYKSFDFLF